MVAPVFFDEKIPPEDKDLKKVLGKAFKSFNEVITFLDSNYDGIAYEWRFYKKSGWFLFYQMKKRRLFYLVPKDNDFTFSVILGGKAVDKIKQGDFPDYIIDILKNAKKYPEGTPCAFDKNNFNARDVIEVLKVKIKN